MTTTRHRGGFALFSAAKLERLANIISMRRFADFFGHKAARLEAERAVVCAAFKAAIHARDTRRQHALQAAAIQATCAALRAEVR